MLVLTDHDNLTFADCAERMYLPAAKYRIETPPRDSISPPQEALDSQPWKLSHGLSLYSVQMGACRGAETNSEPSVSWLPTHMCSVDAL